MRRLSRPQERIGRQVVPIDVWLEIADGNAAEIILFEIRHVFAQALRRSVDPRMCGIRRAVKLKDDDLTIGGATDDALEMFECPIRVGVARRRDEQGMVPFGIIGGADLELAVRGFRLFATPGELVTEFRKSLDRLGAERIATIGKADGARHLGFGVIQRAVNEEKFGGQPGGVFWHREVGMRPTMISNLETHLVNFRNVLPGHEIGRIIHPLVSDKKSSAEAEFFQKRGHEGAM